MTAVSMSRAAGRTSPSSVCNCNVRSVSNLRVGRDKARGAFEDAIPTACSTLRTHRATTTRKLLFSRTKLVAALPLGAFRPPCVYNTGKGEPWCTNKNAQFPQWRSIPMYRYKANRFPPQIAFYMNTAGPVLSRSQGYLFTRLGLIRNR